MKWLIPACLTCVLVLLLFPSEALAWGIGVHLQTGAWILDNLARLPDPIRALLSAHPNDYLYGCISADITLGKKFTHYLRHCHSWRMGCKILENASTAGQRACAYGYLSHLAADTVAHSYFVPYKLIRTYNTVLLKHTYWEMRFEAHVSPDIWPLARSIGRKNFSENDKLLRSVLANTIFSFATNKRLFNSLLLLNRLQQYQKVLRSLARTSKWAIAPADQQDYLDLTSTATLSLLQDLDSSPFRSADPTGERALSTANMIRKNLHTLWLDGRLRESDADEMLGVIKARLKEGICQPDDLLNLLSNA
jgi:hypothetical protein